MDLLPAYSILLVPACKLGGVRQRAYNYDPSVMADPHLRACEMCAFDGIYVFRDNCVYREALGGELTFPGGRRVLRKDKAPDPARVSEVGHLQPKPASRSRE